MSTRKTTVLRTQIAVYVDALSAVPVGRARCTAKRAARYLVLVVMIMAGLESGCTRNDSAEGVADAFLFRYFIELNQRGALELSTGLAADKLREEIELTQSIRMSPDLDLAKQKPFLDYHLVNTKKRGENSVTLFYDVNIESPGETDSKREVVVTTEKMGDVWKVTNFDTFMKRGNY